MFLALLLSRVFTVAFGLVLFVIGSVYGVAGLISFDVDRGRTSTGGSSRCTSSTG